MNATGATMIVIQDFLSLFQGQSLVEHRMNSDMIQGISYNAVWLRLMPNATSSIFFQLRLECGSLKVHDDVTIPWIMSADKEECFIWDMILGMRWGGVCREGANEIRKNQ